MRMAIRKIAGESLLVAPSSAHVIAEPNHSESLSFTITNEGTTPQHLTPTFETLGSPTAGATLNLTLDPATDPTFLNVAGNMRAYITKTFKVPGGMEHLDAAIAFQTVVGSANPPLVFFGLLDPSGRQVAYSIPQAWAPAMGTSMWSTQGRNVDGHCLHANTSRRRQLQRTRAVCLGHGEFRQAGSVSPAASGPCGRRERFGHRRVLDAGIAWG